jgi:hypothetical protein
MAGIVYDYVSIKYIPKGGDIPLFYGDGLQLYKTFLQNPTGGYQQLHQMFSFKDVDILNSHSNFINTVFESIKLIYFILDFFSFGNLYTDTILFNGLAAFAFLHGGIFLRKYFNSFVPFILCFFMPSAFFYTSAIFKEGLVVILICFMLPLAFKIYQSASIKRVSFFLLLFTLLFFFKFLIAVTLLWAIILWWLLLKFQSKRKLVAIAFLTLSVVCFFLMGNVSSKFDLPQNIANRQKEFLELDAHSKIRIHRLQPTFTSFLTSLPSAINNVLFKPLPGEGGKYFYLAFSIELFLFWGIIVFLFAKNKFRANLSVNSLVWCLMLFAVANLLIIGYTIPNIGAITRYRSIFLPLAGLFFWFAFNGDITLTLVRNKLKRL